VVRAIAASEVVVISAVGHEIDVTLADLAADVRAATPSEAAELVAPAAEEIVVGLRHLHKRMSAALGRKAAAARDRLDALARRRVFRRPHDRLHEAARRLDELEARSFRAMDHRLALARRQTDAAAARLDSLSPLAVLGRGYSLTRRESDGRVVRDAGDLSVGQRLTTRFAHGRAISRVEEIENAQ
jgi:exodeoxyribonuclease VII large subunit